MPAVQEFHYRLSAPARGSFPGAHRSKRGDTGFEFRGHVPLLDAPDPRRLDLHASLRDPFGNWMVRVHSQRKAVPVVLVADLSASMGFEGARRKRDVLADFAQSLAWSAWRTGDSFGFVGCDERVREDLFVPQTRSRARAGPLAERLRAWPFEGRSARGLAAAHRHVGRQRALVFLVSDFHLPIGEIGSLLASFAQHELVPVVLWDPLEFEIGPTQGLAPVRDAESGRRTLVWWRPALREKWAAHHAERRESLQRAFRAARVSPLFIEGEFSADAVTRHFHA
jgi:uncharacterized protein (DUF58 family)